MWGNLGRRGAEKDGRGRPAKDGEVRARGAPQVALQRVSDGMPGDNAELHALLGLDHTFGTDFMLFRHQRPCDDAWEPCGPNSGSAWQRKK